MSRFRSPGAGPLSQRELELNSYARLGAKDRAAAEAVNRGLLTRRS